MTQRDAQRERTRTLIVSTAAGMISERGYLGTSIRDVAGALDLTVGAIFFHFKAKEGLAHEIISSFSTRWDALVEEAQQRPGPRLDALVRLSAGVADAYVTDVHVRAAVRLLRERSVVDPTLPAPSVGWVAVVTGFLTAARDAGEVLPTLDVDAAAYQLVCTWLGNQQLASDLDALATLPDRTRQMWRSYLPLLTASTTFDVEAAFTAA